MSFYVVQAGIDGKMYYRRRMPEATKKAARRSALGDMWSYRLGNKLPNENVITRGGHWSEKRLFHPTWFRILKDCRVNGSTLPDPVYQTEWEVGDCPASLDPPLIRGLPEDRPRTKLVDTASTLAATARDKKIRMRLIWRARRDVLEAKQRLNQLKEDSK